MKGKFRLLRHIGLGAFLVCALMLAFIPALQVGAATAVTNVWVDFPMEETPNATSSTANTYIIHFKPATALIRGVDYVTVTFPDGSTAMGPAAFSTISSVAAADVTFSTDYGTTVVGSATWKRITTAATCGGYRVKALVPIDVSASTDVWVKFASTGITSAATEASTYKVYVQTTKDTTPVLSSAFALGDSAPTVAAMNSSYPIPATAGASADYVIEFKPTADLTASTGKVTAKFPVGMTVPSSIAATNVSFSSDNVTYTPCPEAPTVDANTREVTAVTPIAMTGGTKYYMKIVSAAGVTNPTTADDSTYYVMVRTSEDGKYDRSASQWAVTAGSATKVIVANGEIGTPTSRYSDNATQINMYSSQMWVTLADQYGNAKYPGSSVTVNLSSSSSSGAFYKEASGTGGTNAMNSVTSITIGQADPNTNAQIVYYKDTAAGTYTLTFSASGYTSATWTFTVCPGVSLYDSSNNLIKTYGPTSTSTASETGSSSASESNNHSGDYINDAMTAAIAGDTVKLGDGIYELDTVISLSKLITLTSVNGASSTTLRPTDEMDKAIEVTGDGTATNPVIISGFTFTRLRLDYEFDMAIRNAGYDYMTVRNCIFNYVIPDAQAENEGVVWVRTDAGAIASVTISNNTFNNCTSTWPDVSGSKCATIRVSTSSGAGAITGISISGNTLTNCDGYGIQVQGSSGYTVTGSITNNTFTKGYTVIQMDDYVSSSGFSITGNTITDAYTVAIKVSGSTNGPITIKNNTITGSCDLTRGAIRIEHWAKISSTYYTHSVQYNDIYNNNSPYAIYIDEQSGETITVDRIDCRYNWYGDASGPAYTAVTGATVTKSNPNGTGGAITDRVFYYPWLHKSKANVVADNASYQACTMKLVSGWNTLSTPVQLISGASTVAQLIPSGMTIAYYYDEGWHQILTAYTLSPCDAIYVKMSAEKYVLFKFDASAFSTPSKALKAGWNLIGLASLSSSGKSDVATVASVYKTAAGLPGYSQLVSPSINATQTNMFGAAGSSWTYASGETTANTCYAGLGYWVYMQNAATLAGFEITPIAPDLD